MPERLFFIVVVLIFTFNGEILGQQKIVENFPPIVNNINHFTVAKPGYGQWIKRVNTPSSYGEKGDYFLNKKPNPVINAPLAKDFYSCHLSFFCKKELQIEKATTLPLRFRLGSLQYTDYLEKKPNALWGR
jgi:hypothetical protein